MADMDMLRRFAGADPDDEDKVLAQCHAAAVAWFAQAGIPPDTKNDLYDFWVADLTSWLYDNRGSDKDIPPYIISSVHQLRPTTNTEAAT